MDIVALHNPERSLNSRELSTPASSNILMTPRRSSSLSPRPTGAIPSTSIFEERTTTEGKWKKRKTRNTPFRRPSCQAREEKRKFSPTATSLRRRRQRSRTWATAQRALAEERKWRPKVHQARRDDRFSSRFLSLLLTAAIVPTRPTPLLLCSPLPLSLSDQVWCIQRCDCVNCT